MGIDHQSLSRSLSKVFAQSSRTAGSGGPVELPLTAIDPPAANPRQSFDQEALAELAASIRRYGLLQPILVLERGDRYEILAGERRYRACLLAGMERVPVVVRHEDDDQRIAELRLIENLQRQDLDPIELAIAYQHLIEDHGLTQEALAERLGKGRSSISNTLRLLSLPQEVQMRVVRGECTLGHVKPLIGLPAAQAIALAERIVREDLSARQVEGLVRQRRSTTEVDEGPPAKRSRPVHLRELEGNLERLFDARVRVSERGGRGSLTIDFHSKGHFKSIIDALERASQVAAHTPERGDPQ